MTQSPTRPLRAEQTVFNMPTDASQSRIGKLDSVRGIAALMVVVGHCGGWPMLPDTHGPFFWWLSVFSEGEAAVLMFFLLSGFVLALQLNSSKSPTYLGFVIRRFFRIWPTFAVTVILAYLLLHWFGVPVPAETGSTNAPALPTPSALAQNLLMVGSPHTIDPPVWSLYVEARVSLIFPLLCLLAYRLNFYWATILSLVASVLVSRLIHWDIPEVLLSLAAASRFIVLFVIGAALTRAHNPVAVLYGRLPLPIKTFGLVVALICLEYRFIPTELPLPLLAYVRWLGVSLLFVYCLYSETAETLLNRRPLLFLGRISYSLYLVAFPIMLVVEANVPRPWSTFLVLLLSIVAAWFINSWVERPMIALGRILSPPADTQVAVARF